MVFKISGETGNEFQFLLLTNLEKVRNLFKGWFTTPKHYSKIGGIPESIPPIGSA